MEKDTVLLSIEKYNELRDFKKKIEKGKVYVDYQSYGFGSYSKTYYYTNSEVVAEINEQKEKLKEEAKELQKQIRDLKKQIEGKKEPKPITIDDIKRMSYWQFRKWKRVQKH